MEIAAVLRARIAHKWGTLVNVMNAMRICPTETGATSASASNAEAADDGEDDTVEVLIRFAH